MSEPVPLTLVKAEDFKKMIADANRILDVVRTMEIPAFACGLAGVSLIRGCISAIGGEMSWWINLIKEGPDSMVVIPMPDGTNTLGKGPSGKQ